MSKRIAVLGAGIIASGIIKNFQQQGHSLNIFNRTKKRALSIASKNDTVYDTPCKAVKDCSLVISCVSDDEASNEIWTGINGALEGVEKDAFCIEMSTLSLSYIDSWGQMLRRFHVIPIDCPVTGSKSGAESGTLSLFIGSDQETILPIIDRLNIISKERYFFEEFGNGMRFKLLYNMLSSVILGAFSEAVEFSRILNLNVQQVVDILSSNGWSSLVGKGKGGNILQNNHNDVHCSLKNLTKDLKYGLDAVKELDYSFSTAECTMKLFEKAQQLGKGNLDISAVSYATQE